MAETEANEPEGRDALHPRVGSELKEYVDALAPEPENDLVYLLGLVGESIRDRESFQTDEERAEWVVAHFCQELQKVPDITEYETGKIVPRGEQEMVSQEWMLHE